MSFFQSGPEVDELVRLRRDAIPLAERCSRCGGAGKVITGCAIVRAVYADCFQCCGTGRNRGDGGAVRPLGLQ